LGQKKNVTADKAKAVDKLMAAFGSDVGRISDLTSLTPEKYQFFAIAEDVLVYLCDSVTLAKEENNVLYQFDAAYNCSASGSASGSAHVRGILQCHFIGIDSNLIRHGNADALCNTSATVCSYYG